MGAFGSKQFIRNEKIDGQGKSLLTMAKKLNLKMHELDRIYHEYCKYEDKSTHLVEIKFIFNCCQIPYQLFDRLLCQIFDQSKSGYLNFMNYMMVMWSLLSTDEDGLAILCFSLMDIDRTNTLFANEVKYIVNVLWQFKPSNQTKVALKKLDLNKDGFVTISEFVLLNRHHSDLLRPVRQVKTRLRQKTVFTRFWKQIMRRRVADFGAGTVFEIMGINDSRYVQSSVDYLNLQTEVPAQFIEQYKLTRRKKLNSKKGDMELPYEVTSQLCAERSKNEVGSEPNSSQRKELEHLMNEQALQRHNLTSNKPDEADLNDDEGVVADILQHVKIKSGSGKMRSTAESKLAYGDDDDD